MRSVELGLSIAGVVLAVVDTFELAQKAKAFMDTVVNVIIRKYAIIDKVVGIAVVLTVMIVVTMLLPVFPYWVDRAFFTAHEPLLRLIFYVLLCTALAVVSPVVLYHATGLLLAAYILFDSWLPRRFLSIAGLLTAVVSLGLLFWPEDEIGRTIHAALTRLAELHPAAGS